MSESNRQPAPRWPNDHWAPGHIHRPSYGGDGCPVCDEMVVAELVRRRQRDDAATAPLSPTGDDRP